MVLAILDPHGSGSLIPLVQDIQNLAHSIKGAAANLMCYRLRQASFFLEKVGSVGGAASNADHPQQSFDKVLEGGLEVLLKEMDTLHAFLKSKKLL
ncbi:unnamed protein product [Discosporangium mesarthrocarpum]